MGAPRFNNALKISIKQSTIVQKYPGHLMSYHTAINLCLCLATYLQHLRQSLPPPIPCPLPIHLRRNPGGGGGAIGTIWPCYSLPLFASLLPQIKTIWRWGIAAADRSAVRRRSVGRSVGRTRVIRRGGHTQPPNPIGGRGCEKRQFFSTADIAAGREAEDKAPALIGFIKWNEFYIVSALQR